MRKFGHWVAIGVADETGKALVVKCKCGRIATVSVEALTSGTSTSCGCAPLSAKQKEQRQAARLDRQRHRDHRAWRPGERS